MVAGGLDTYFQVMRLPCQKALLAAMVAFAVAQVDVAAARPRNSGVPNIMVDMDASGTPIIMHGLPKSPKSSVPGATPPIKSAEHPRRIARGSSGYVELTPLPRTGLISAGPAVAPYIPPPIANPSERIQELNHSFPLNRGLGLNPTDRDAYIRYNLTR
jgi:hypothetical protein